MDAIYLVKIYFAITLAKQFSLRYSLVIAANNQEQQMTKAEMRKEFEAYYADLKADAKANGYRVNKEFEWERFQELQAA